MSANDQVTPSGDLLRKPRRRWQVQVSLRTLLILVTLLSIGLGRFVHRGERQRRAVAALKEVGEDDFGSVPCIGRRPPIGSRARAAASPAFVRCCWLRS